MWTPPLQSFLLQVLIQANALHPLLLTSTTAAPAGWTLHPANRTSPHRDPSEKLVVPIDLSILRTVPEVQDPRPLLLAVDVASLHHGRESDQRSDKNSVRNDIVLIPDLTLPARIKNDYAPQHRLTARVASIGNDRIPVFEHLYSSYGQGQTKDALWDFLEDEDNHLSPGTGDYDYPEDYGAGEEDDLYWYNNQELSGPQADEYEGSDNRITFPPRQYSREKKKKTEDKGREHKSAPSLYTRWRPAGKKTTKHPELKASLVSKWAWSRGGKKNIFFTTGWGPGGRAWQEPPSKSGPPPQEPPEDKEEKAPTMKQPPWRRPSPMWGVPHLFGPYW